MLRKERPMKNEEITVKSVEELIALIENMPDDTVLEIDLGGEDDNDGDKEDV